MIISIYIEIPRLPVTFMVMNRSATTRLCERKKYLFEHRKLFAIGHCRANIKRLGTRDQFMSADNGEKQLLHQHYLCQVASAA